MDRQTDKYVWWQYTIMDTLFSTLHVFYKSFCITACVSCHWTYLEQYVELIIISMTLYYVCMDLPKVDSSTVERILSISVENQEISCYLHRVSSDNYSIISYHYTKITFVCPSVRESGRSWEAIRPVLKTFPFSGSLELHTTPKSPPRQPAMALAPD